MIKPKTAIAAAAAALLVSSAPSCSKYEDGPKLSFRSPTSRLAREWAVKDAEQSGFPDDFDMTFDFDKDGDLKFNVSGTYTYYGTPFPVNYTMKGDWEWQDKKEMLDITFENQSNEFKVLRLTPDEMVWEDEDGGEWKLEAK